MQGFTLPLSDCLHYYLDHSIVLHRSCPSDLVILLLSFFILKLFKFVFNKTFVLFFLSLFFIIWPSGFFIKWLLLTHSILKFNTIKSFWLFYSYLCQYRLSRHLNNSKSSTTYIWAKKLRLIQGGHCGTVGSASVWDICILFLECWLESHFKSPVWFCANDSTSSWVPVAPAGILGFCF